MALVCLVGRVDLLEQILLLLGSRFVLERIQNLARPSPLARPGPLVLVRQPIVLALALPHLTLQIRHLLLGRESIRLPGLAVPLGIHGQIDEVVVHGVQAGGEVRAVVGHALVDVDHLFVGLGEGANAVVGATHGVLGRAADFLEVGCVVVFEVGALFEEEGEFLGVLLGGDWNRGWVGLDLLWRMLCYALGG